MSAEQFEELMRVLRAGFLMLAMIGYANVFEPKERAISKSQNLLMAAVQTVALVIAPWAMMKVLQ